MDQERLEKFVGQMMPQFDERLRRLFLASLVENLGHGSLVKISDLTGVSRPTIIAGKRELATLPCDPKARPKKSEIEERIRSEGAGRKPVEEIHPEIKEKLLTLLDGNTVGNPENPLTWTTKSLRNLQEELEREGIKVSHPTIGALLEEMGFSLQQNKKYTEAGDPGPDRDEQFQFINTLSKSFLSLELPVISVDAKKKELIGSYKNNGKEYCPKGQPILVNDHDFPDKKLGKAVPYGIYDIGRNEGFVNVGISADTAEFAVNSIRDWWSAMGKKAYPDAKQLLITCDGGGSNGRRNRLWKASLQEFANETGLTIHVSHFPPGTSKWNKIEHRLFSYISKNWRGRPLETLAIIVSLIASTTTKSGLRVQCQDDQRKYEKGIKITDEEMEKLNFMSKNWHGEWNYQIFPQ